MNEEVHAEISDSDFLFDLADRLMRVATPTMGFDQADTDRICRIASEMRDRDVSVDEGFPEGVGERLKFLQEVFNKDD